MLIPISAHGESAIVQYCTSYKKRVQAYAKTKKSILKRCYAYFKNEFFGDDLLPSLSATGNENDANTNRPEVFIPVTREQIKLLYSYLKLTLFPNNEDYFRVKAKYPSGTPFEYSLTEGLKHLFKEGLITEKLGAFLLDTLWAGFAVAHPTFEEQSYWEWQVELDENDELQARPIEVNNPALLSLDIWNPLMFYLDPQDLTQKNRSWGYFTKTTINQLTDKPFLLNRDAIKNITKSSISGEDTLNIDEYNQMNSTSANTAEMVNCDYYYFPTLCVDDTHFKNVLVTIVNGTILAEFKPNTLPKGMNPVVYCTWMDDRESPYGTGPAEDIKDLQRLINILYNYQIETFARIGNRFIVKDTVDLTNFFGIAGGVATAQNPQQDIVPLTGDYIETAQLSNLIGTLKAEAQLLAGTQNPFQGSSNIDFKKTATEIQLLQENSISIIREIVEHLSNCGIKPILERLGYIAASIYRGPFQVSLSDGNAQVLTDIDLAPLLSGDFTIELVSLNPSQSKQVQADSLLKLTQLISDNPDLLIIAEPVIVQLGLLWGIKDIKKMLSDIREKIGYKDSNTVNEVRHEPG
jgi:hypothetical protein